MQTYFDIETGKFYGRFKDRASPSGYTWEQIDPDSYELEYEFDPASPSGRSWKRPEVK